MDRLSGYFDVLGAAQARADALGAGGVGVLNALLHADFLCVIDNAQ